MSSIALTAVVIVVIIAGMATFLFFLPLRARKRAPREIPASPRKTSRFTESMWLTEEEFEEFKRKHNLVPPKNPSEYTVWVRSGSFAVAAVGMKNAEKVYVTKAQTTQ